MEVPRIAIITPTTGKASLSKLIRSIDRQNIPCVHILLWDNIREGQFLYPTMAPEGLMTLRPDSLDIMIDGRQRYSLVLPYNTVNGFASGSFLRAIGLMAANTPYVTFGDDDVWYDDNHFENLLKTVEGKCWGYCRRRVWTDKECIGEDNFESVGEDGILMPYKLVDNNCMIFERRFGVSGACLYNSTMEYNDDRLFYSFLKQYAGEPGKSSLVTVNQVCPKRLEPMFRQLCTKTDMTGTPYNLEG